MGQVESAAAASTVVDEESEAPKSSTSTSVDMESVIGEALAYGNDENESLDEKAQKALECPCVAELRNGPCGKQFSEAFVCFIKSTAEEKGSDCVNPFVALQKCIQANPDAFSKEVLEEEEEVKKDEEPSQEYRIIPPIWSRESKSPKPKL